MEESHVESISISTATTSTKAETSLLYRTRQSILQAALLGITFRPVNVAVRFIIPRSLLSSSDNKMLKLSEAKTLLDNDYFPLETGCGLTEDNMYHVATSTYMPGVTAAMIDWWFGWIHTTEQYKLWHPRDHVFSDWEGPRENNSTYIGGHHLVHEYIGGDLQKLKISFKSPSVYFGDDWEKRFKEKDYGTAIVGRVGFWVPETNAVSYVGHLIHLIKNEPDGVRMRSRFWLGDVEGAPAPVGNVLPRSLTFGLMKHCTEEMAILASKLPFLYQKYAKH